MPLESFRVEKEQVGREVVVVVDYVSENTLDYWPCFRDVGKMLGINESVSRELKG
jgi:hypothetical protein